MSDRPTSLDRAEVKLRPPGFQDQERKNHFGFQDQERNNNFGTASAQAASSLLGKGSMA